MHLLLCPNPWSKKTIPGFSSEKSLRIDSNKLGHSARLCDFLCDVTVFSCLNFPIMSSCTDRKRSKGWRYNKPSDNSSTLFSPNRCNELQSPSLPLAVFAEDHGKPLEERHWQTHVFPKAIMIHDMFLISSSCTAKLSCYVLDSFREQRFHHISSCQTDRFIMFKQH